MKTLLAKLFSWRRKSHAAEARPSALARAEIDLTPGRAMFDGLAITLRNCVGIREQSEREAAVRRAFSRAARDFVRLVNRAADVRQRHARR